MIVGLSLAGALLLAISAPLIVRLLAPGLDEEGAALAAGLIRIMAFILPAGLFLATCRSLLNAGRRFGIPAALTMLPRVFVLCTLLLLLPPMGVSSLAWALLFGSALAGLLIFLVLVKVLPAVRRESAADGRPLQRESSGRLWPSILNHGYGQGIIWVDLAFATLTGAGGLSVLEYGTRLMTIFPALLSTSVITVMYTEYSHRSLEEGGGSLQRSIVRTARGGLFLILPMVGFIAFLGDDIVGLLLHRGAFDAEAATKTVSVMRLVAPATVFAFLANNLMSGVYADPTAPRLKIIGTTISVSLAGRIVFIFLLIGPMGIGGVALGGSIAALCMLAVLYTMLRRRWGGFLKRSDARSVAGISVSTAGSILLIYWLREWFGVAPDAGGLTQLAALAGYAAAGGVCYLGLAVLLRVREIADAKDILLRRRS